MRILLYSHDTYGLGHVRRTLALARRFAEDLPRASQLLLTGSMQSNQFALPERLDYIKLPAISKCSDGRYCSRVLPLPFEAVKALREKVIFDAVRHFEPDVVLVDKAPAGTKGELRRSLRYLKASRPWTKLVFGMRDIEDGAARVRREWTRQGIYRLLDDVYDVILLYGERAIYDPVEEYGLIPRVASKVISCGYLGRFEPLRHRDELRRGLGMQTDHLVVVTTGGGGDGFTLVNAYLQMLAAVHRRLGQAPFHSLVILGPLMPSAQRARLRRYETLGLPLTMMEFTPDAFSYLHAADAVVSMGGYNSVCEILSLRKRALVVPRVRPRVEQLIRAERFAVRGLVRMIRPDELAPSRLLTEINALLEDGRPVRAEEAGVELNGVAKASHAIAGLLAEGGAVPSPAFRIRP